MNSVKKCLRRSRGLHFSFFYDFRYIDDIIIGDAQKVLPTLSDNSYESVIAIDIFEHFTKENGVMFLQQFRRVASRAVLISTPKEFIE